MSYVVFNVVLFDALGRYFRLVFVVRDVEEIHFALRPTNSWGGTELVSSLNLPTTFALEVSYRSWSIRYALVS